MVPAIDYITQQWIAQNIIDPNDPKDTFARNKLSFVAQITAKAWNVYILNHVAQAQGMDPDSKEFKKFKNSKHGKEVIDEAVTGFYYHLHETFEGWEEAQRQELQNQFLDQTADELMMLIQHTSQLAESQQSHFNYQEENVRRHNPNTEGIFGGWQ